MMVSKMQEKMSEGDAGTGAVCNKGSDKERSGDKQKGTEKGKKIRNYEFTVRVGDEDWKVITACSPFFLQGCSGVVHRHCCTEIHMVVAGTIGYQVDGKDYILHAGDVLLIPAMTFHDNYMVENDMQVLVVRTDRMFEQLMYYRVLPGIVEELCAQLHKAEQNGNCARVREYLALILSAAVCDSGALRPVRDKKLIIEEFFDNNYNKEVTLSDLAEELELSNVQTERQIAKYLGTTFRKAIAEKRIKAAKHILATEGISLAEAAERVGYRSYSGFWKAFRTENSQKVFSKR